MSDFWRGFKSIASVAVLGMMLVGCGPVIASTVNPTPAMSWQGIEPGVTSREEVLAILGSPDVVGWDGNEGFFEYRLPGQEYDEYNHRVFFSSGIVSWLDTAIVVNPEAPYTVSVAMEEFGSTVDRVVRTKHGRDIWTGEHIYIWASRGIALVAVPETVLAWELPSGAETQCRSADALQERYPDETTPIIPEFADFPDPCQIAVRLVIFPPMPFEEYWGQYEHRMPDLWPFYEGYVQD